MQLKRPTIHSIMITSGLYFIIIAIIIFMAIQNSRLKISLTEHRAYIMARDMKWIKMFQEHGKLIEKNKEDVEVSQKFIQESKQEIQESKKDILETQKDIKESKKEILESKKDIKQTEQEVKENKRLAQEIKDLLENFVRRQFNIAPKTH